MNWFGMVLRFSSERPFTPLPLVTMKSIRFSSESVSVSAIFSQLCVEVEKKVD